jgi:2',3'-cyclic-nucleotide 2'-phosphodiesterase (5'-nucleotidase family)
MKKNLPQGFIKGFIHLWVYISFSSCQPKQFQSIDLQESKSISGSELKLDPAAEALIVPYREPLQGKMQEILCYSNAPATKELPESSIGNLIADLLRSQGASMSGLNVDVCFMNQGGLRIEWPQGAITRSMVLEIMPFENRLQIVSMDSLQLDALFTQIAKRGGAPLSGVRLKIDSNNALLSWTGLKGKNLFNVITSDYLINGGDSYTIGYKELLWTGPKVRDGIEQAISAVHAAGDTLKPSKDGRISKIQAP